MSNVLRRGPHQVYRKTSPSTVSEAALNRPISSAAPKRTRSPPQLSSADETLEGSTISLNDNSERYVIRHNVAIVRFLDVLSPRIMSLMLFILNVSFSEMLAKAKRLARFKVELSKSEQNNSDIAEQKASTNRNEQFVLEHKYVEGHSTQAAGNLTNASSDFEGSETSNIIIGLCPDMCHGIFIRF